MAERYKLGDIDNEQFYMLPKGLFTNPLYRNISIAAKVTYALFKDRMELSRKNGWHDDNGDIYLVYPLEQIESDLNIAHATAAKVINELRRVGLIDTVRRGLGKANIIYIKKFKNYTSESMKFKLQEVQNLYSNNTDMSETDNSNTEKGAKPSKSKRKAFTPPLFEEVLAYVMDKGLNVDAKRFFDYYEAGDWHDAKGKPVKNWKQKCITWDKHQPSQPNKDSTKAIREEVTMSPEEYRRQQEELEAKARAELMKLGE